MQRKLLKLGTALTVAAAFVNATTAPAAAGGYGYNAALINHYIQKAPVTSYGHDYGHGYDYGYSSGYGYGHDYGYSYTPSWKTWDDGRYGWSYKPDHKVDYGWSYVPEYPVHYSSDLGHGTVSYYDGYGDPVYYGAPSYAKRTTIVHPTLSYDGYGQVHKVVVDNHVLHVRKHATDLRDPVFFDFGSSTLSHEAKLELDKIGQIISAYYFSNPKVVILLSGFTDATGSPSANEALAKARNEAVKHYLMQEFGFSEARFVLRAVGEEYANMSGMPYSENQRKVTVSLVGLPRSVTDHGHQHPAPAAAHSHEMAPAPTHEAPAMAAEKGEVEMSPVEPAEEHAAAPAPVMKPMPKPMGEPVYTEKGYVAPVYSEPEPSYMAPKPVYAGHMEKVNRCIVPTGPYAGTYVNGTLVATLFTDIDDYGGGRLEEVCALSY